ncbi:relaxase/mobilization nuclease domain-containing protein [Helicobacter ganmani]|uniref:relaxase/mobilization nuclease domain-containing protein n=1 Tax=Helicobacter ganmani TaxID=60246 RepID=UPI003A844713
MHFDENLDFGFANLKYNPDTFLEDYKKIKSASSKEIKFQKAKLVFGKSLNYKFSKANKSQAVVVKLLSNLGKKGVKNAISYCIRNSENSFAINENGELVTTKEILQEWGKNFSDNENSKEAWHLCFSIKERATQQNLEKLQASVSEVMQQNFFGYKYAMILHTHQNNPHIHIIVNKRNFLTNKKIHFKNKGDIKEFFSDIRDDFAYSLRARGLNYENKSALEKNLEASFQRKKERMDTLQTDFREFFKSYYDEYDFKTKNYKDIENKREKIANLIKENENLYKQKSNLIDLLVQYTEQKNKKKFQTLQELKKINQSLKEQKFTIARELKELNLLEKQQLNFKNMQIKVLYGTTHNVFIQKDFIKNYEKLYPNHKGASKTQIKEYFLVKSAIKKQTKEIETNYRKVIKENDLDFLKTYNPALKTNAFKLAKGYKELEKNIYLLQNSPLESYEIKSYIENLQKNQKFIQKLMNNRSLELEKQIKEKMHKDSRIQHLETRSKSDNFLINEYSLTCQFLQKESFIKLKPRDLQTNTSGANAQTQTKEAEQEQQVKAKEQSTEMFKQKKIEAFRKMQGR